MTAPQPGGAVRTAPLRQVEFLVPLRERGPIGQIHLQIDEDRFFVPVSEFVGLMAPIIKPEAVATIEREAGPDGRLSDLEAVAAGFRLTFDTSLLELAVEIPLDARLRRVVNLDNERTIPFDTTDRSPDFAAAVNYRIGVDYVHKGIETGLTQPIVDFEFDGRLFQKVAFENEFSFDGGADGDDFIRFGSRLIYDDRNRDVRWTAGDLIGEAEGYQNNIDIAGLSLARRIGQLNSDRSLTAKTSRTIVIREPSTLEIRVNGLNTRRIRLQPGEYNLRDFPLAAGANKVDLVIETDGGRQEVITFDYFSDLSLLAPGVDEFYFGLGVHAPRLGGGPDYRSDEFAASGFYRRGFNDRMTLGGNFQMLDSFYMVGGDVLYGADIGFFGLQTAATHSEGGSGAAARLDYRWSQFSQRLGGERQFNASVELRSRDFNARDIFGVANPKAILAARYSQPITPTINGSVGFDYSFERGGQKDRYGVSAYINWQLPRDLDVNAGFSYENDNDEPLNVFVSLTKRFGIRSSVRLSAETRNERVSATYSRAPDKPIDDWAATVDVSRTDRAIGANGSVTYLTNRGDAELSHYTVFDENGGEILQQATQGRFHGAFAFAGGKFAVGRRVSDAFAIVSGHPTLEGRQVLIRSQFSDFESARSGAFGPALVSLGAYAHQVIPYDVEDLPQGYDLGAGAFEVFPWLHAGLPLEVGTAFNITAVGELLDRDGQPVVLRAGSAQRLGDPTAPKVDVVTNRAGRFGATGLSPGRWRITLLGEDELIYDLQVPEDRGMLIRTGPLRPVGNGEVQ